MNVFEKLMSKIEKAPETLSPFFREWMNRSQFVHVRLPDDLRAVKPLTYLRKPDFNGPCFCRVFDPYRGHDILFIFGYIGNYTFVLDVLQPMEAPSNPQVLLDLTILGTMGVSVKELASLAEKGDCGALVLLAVLTICNNYGEEELGPVPYPKVRVIE